MIYEFLDTWISSICSDIALYFDYKYKKKILKKFCIMHINLDG